MIGDDAHLVFILGMDREKVAAALTLKSKDVLQFLTTSNSSDTGGARHPASFGYGYLEKFIQIAFRVPRPKGALLGKFLKSLDGKLTEDESFAEEQESQGRERRRVRVNIHVGPDSEQVKTLTTMFARYFDHNPRRLKQFINSFRLQANIAASLRVLDYEEDFYQSHGVGPDASEQRSFLTLEQIGKFIAVGLCWPDLIADIAANVTLLEELTLKAELGLPAKSGEQKDGQATGNSTAKLSPAAERWSSVAGLLALLREGISDFPDGWRHSLRGAPIVLLLDITPRPKRTNNNTEQSPAQSVEEGGQAAEDDGDYRSEAALS
jgi:hypothetical protein